MKIKRWFLHLLLPPNLYLVRYEGIGGGIDCRLFFDRDEERKWVRLFTDYDGKIVSRDTIRLYL